MESTDLWRMLEQLKGQALIDGYPKDRLVMETLQTPTHPRGHYSYLRRLGKGKRQRRARRR